MAAALSGADADLDDRAERLRDDIAADRDQLTELAGMYADRAITAAE